MDNKSENSLSVPTQVGEASTKLKGVVWRRCNEFLFIWQINSIG